jgi:hypothetical protein
MEFTTRTINLSDGTVIQAWDSVGVKTTWKGSPRKADRFIAQRAYERTPVTECANDSFGHVVAERAKYLPTGTVYVAALGNLKAFSFGRNAPAEQVQFAPQLDCELVYRFTAFSHSGGGTDISERVPKSYALGDPSPALFDASSLGEASPVTAFVTQYRKIGWPEDQIGKHVTELKPTEDTYLRQ